MDVIAIKDVLTLRYHVMTIISVPMIGAAVARDAIPLHIIAMIIMLVLLILVIRN
jgi:hypothetical protein